MNDQWKNETCETCNLTPYWDDCHPDHGLRRLGCSEWQKAKEVEKPRD
jgi:hypothetical protein